MSSPFEVTQDDNGYDVSTCVVEPPNNSGSSRETESLQFEYFVYLNETVTMDTAQDIVTSLEPSLNLVLSDEAMSCDYGDSFFSLYELSAADGDVVLGRCPDITPDAGQSCWLVNGKLTTSLYFSGGRRHLRPHRSLFSSEVLDTFIGWLVAVFPALVDDSTVFGMQLQGFTNVDPDGEEHSTVQDTVNNDIGATGLNDGGSLTALENQNTTYAIGAIIVGMAALALLVMVFTSLSRRRRRHEAYMKHLNMVNGLQLTQDEMLGPEEPAIIVNDEAEREISKRINRETASLGLKKTSPEDPDRDYRESDDSPSWDLCANQSEPIFIATDVDGVGAEVVADLGPKQFRRNTSDTPQVDNTQAL